MCLFHDREKGASMVTTLGKNAEFAEFDINDDKSLESALNGALILQKHMKNCIFFLLLDLNP